MSSCPSYGPAVTCSCGISVYMGQRTWVGNRVGAGTFSSPRRHHGGGGGCGDWVAPRLGSPFLKPAPSWPDTVMLMAA